MRNKLRRLWARWVVRRAGYCVRHLIPLRAEVEIGEYEISRWCQSCLEEKQNRERWKLHRALEVLRG